jgi:hypothetical protein
MKTMQPAPAVRRKADFDWDLKRPCADCPFRIGVPFHEGIALDTVGIVEAIRQHTFAHTCHKTDNFSDSPEGQRFVGRFKHCIGSLIMLIKTGRGCDLQIPFLEAAQAGKLDLDELMATAKADKDCYTLNEFLLAQAAGLEAIERRMRNRRRGKKVKVQR